MDKRWRNLIIIIVVVVAVVLIYNSGALNNLFKSPEEQRIESYFTLIEQNDVNYGDMKIVLELFDLTFEDTVLDNMEKSAPDEIFKQLLIFEKKQNEIVDNLDAFYSKDLEYSCLNTAELRSLESEAFALVIEMDAYFSTHNVVFDLDMDVVDFSERELEEGVLDFIAMCTEIESMVIVE